MLKIKVNDTIKVCDSTEKVVVYLKKVVEEWLDDGDELPLNISVIREANKAPPRNINISESITIKEALA